MSPITLEHLGDGSHADRNFRTLAAAVSPPVPQARVFNSAAIATTTAVVKVVTFDSERFDNGGLHSTSSNTSRLTAPITGLYEIGACVEFASNATGYREVYFTLNGATAIAVDVRPAVNGQATVLPLSTQYRLVAGDYVEVNALQTSGGNLNVNAAANYSPEFWMTRLAGYVNQGV